MALDPLVRPSPTEVMQTPFVKKLNTLSPPQPSPENLFKNDDADVQSLIEAGPTRFRHRHAFRDEADAVEDDADAMDDAYFVFASNSSTPGKYSGHHVTPLRHQGGRARR